MRLRIHRGAAEIGGNCVEVEASGQSILLDLGAPLTGDLSPDEALPPIKGLVDGANPNLLGIVISHPHADHYGLASLADGRSRSNRNVRITDPRGPGRDNHG